jgi:hypothetical protein
MARAFVTHPVADYDKWRPIFDADRPRLAAAGVTVAVETYPDRVGIVGVT